MKLHIILIILLLTGHSAFAQFGEFAPALYHNPEGGDTIYMHTDVDELASYAQGDDAFKQAFFGVLKYPAGAREGGIQGKVVLSFIVEKDGTATDLKVARPVHHLLDSAAINAFKNVGTWKPAMINGKPVRCQVLLPVAFKLG